MTSCCSWLSEYWCHSTLWSMAGLAAGIGIGNLIWSPSRKELRMSIRDKTRLRDVLFGVAFLLLGAYTLIATQQARSCVLNYIEKDSATSKVRSGLVEKESQTNRQAFLGAFSARDRADFEAVAKAYQDSLQRIDKAREENPVKRFDKATCE